MLCLLPHLTTIGRNHKKNMPAPLREPVGLEICHKNPTLADKVFVEVSELCESAWLYLMEWVEFVCGGACSVFSFLLEGAIQAQLEKF